MWLVIITKSLKEGELYKARNSEGFQRLYQGKEGVSNFYLSGKKIVACLVDV